jgi:hypothetical protein
MMLPAIAKLLPSCALLLALGAASVTHAESFRCGTKLALPGDTRMEVRAKCGEPSDVATSTLIRRSGISGRSGLNGITGQTHLPGQHGLIYSEEEIVVIPVEVWTYNLGPHRLMHRLRFVNGILETVETMSYGFNDDTAK